ncbi:MAG: class I adenylate-forming enzyme family protein [Smithellaceae bacterium]
MKTLFKPSMIHKSRALGARRFYGILNEYECLKKNAFAYPKSEALIDTFYGVDREKRRRKTWPQVLEDVNLYIFNLMERDLFKGSTLVVQLPNCLEHYYSFLAASKIGCWHLSNHVDFGPAETKAILEHIEPDIAIIVPSWRGRDIAGWYKEYQKAHPSLKHIFVVGDVVPEGMKPASELLNPKIKELYKESDLDDLRINTFEPWMLLETSGTTGMPKIIMQDSSFFQSHDIAIAERFNFTSYDRMLLFGPMSGTTGKRFTTAFALWGGTCSILITEYSDEAACRLTEEEKATIWGGIPTLGERALSGPLAEKYDLSSMRTFPSGGAPVSQEVSSKLLAKGVKIFTSYGTTEVGGVAQTNLTHSSEEMLRSAGTVREGCHVAIVDTEGNEVPQGETGEIYAWGIHHGYYKQPEFDKESWVAEGKWEGYQRTGDLGRFDERGFLYIVGRTKDMILRGAQNIFPKEIEDVLIGHPSIHQVAIVKMPDPILHEKACAYVVLNKGKQLTLDDIKQFLDGKGMQRIKFPERLEIIDEMPVNVGGKVNKKELEKNIAEKIKNES